MEGDHDRYCWNPRVHASTFSDVCSWIRCHSYFSRPESVLIRSTLVSSSKRCVCIQGGRQQGKTEFLRRLSRTFPHRFSLVSISSILSSTMGLFESLREVERWLRLGDLEQSPRDSLSILFIDDVDVLLEMMESSTSFSEGPAAIFTLCEILENIHDSPSCLFIGSVSSMEKIPSSIKKYIGDVLHLFAPSPADRFSIVLDYLHNVSNFYDLRDVDEMEKWAGEISESLVGASIGEIMLLLQKVFSGIQFFSSKERELGKNVVYRECELNRIRLRSLHSDFAPHQSAYRVEDLGGLSHIVSTLQSSIIDPLTTLGGESESRQLPPVAKGILFFGPPGCGKTHLAHAIAQKTGVNYFPVRGTSLLSKVVGDSEKAVSDVFSRARAAAPSIVFIDQIDAIAVRRGRDASTSGSADRLLSTLLSELDGLYSGDELHPVVLFAATNRAEVLDDAILRPGRLDFHIFMDLPNANERVEIWKVYLGRSPLFHLSDADIEDLAFASEGYSGAEIELVCREMSMNFLRSCLQNQKEIVEEIQKISSSSMKSLFLQFLRDEANSSISSSCVYFDLFEDIEN